MNELLDFAAGYFLVLPETASAVYNLLSRR
ncbi:hypothetical protein CEB3_c51150 [Peptococcaceae bacterium CEB3]|nr:hypothetical protein CEB3_c51150 [Peptococcaceae bacterium CEB3]